MNDGLNLFDDLSPDDTDADDTQVWGVDEEYEGYDDYDDRRDTRDTRARRRPAPPPPRRRRRRGLRWTILLVLVVVIGAGVYFGVRQVLGFGTYPDYAGPGDTDVVFSVNSGDTLSDIGDNMAQAGIVRSSGALVKAGKNNSQAGGVQPGFYVMKRHASGAAAIARLVDPASRVGLLKIQSGWQLDDTTSSSGKVTKGILSRLAAASCATLNGRSTCLTVDGLRAAVGSADPAALGVPAWAVPSVAAADARHRLEGLITPGVYNIKPGEDAVATLKRILTQSSLQLQAAGLPSSNQQSTGFSPYQVLTLASIVEREAGTTPDMNKIARVFYNRLKVGMPLQSDATVDYGLDRPMVTTAPAERAGAGPYNTYVDPGLPPTPVSSPSAAAIQATSQPADGDWLYFVVCQKDGSSCFANNINDHNKNVTTAIANGVF